MPRIGILAYGSLIDDPRDEIEGATAARIQNVETPFKVEFARSSGNTRDGAPTLIPVGTGGAKVNAIVFVLKDSVSEQEATDILWRRETGRIGSGRSYNPSARPDEGTVIVEKLLDFAGLDVVIYTKIAANINPLMPESLADYAIKSAQAKAGKTGKDGINYLISAKHHGIVTPLMAEYEKAILQQTGTETLEEALDIIRSNSSN